MSNTTRLSVYGFVAAAILLAGAAADSRGEEKVKEWSINATVIEACSCPMFCQCYFNTKPAAHGHHGHEEHFCRFNNAYKINRGHYGEVKLDGAKFWLAGDLGPDFSEYEMDWHVLVFDKSATEEQRQAISAIVSHLIPAKWKSTSTTEGEIQWTYDADSAHATLDGGKTAEVKLTRFQGMTDDPVVIHNLKYWGAPKNDGFVLMPSELEAYRVGDKAFEFKGTNGFMLTFEMSSEDVAQAKTGM